MRYINFVLCIFISISFIMCDKKIVDEDSGSDKIKLIWLKYLDQSATSEIIMDNDYIYFQDTHSKLYKVSKDGKEINSFNTLNGNSFGHPFIFENLISAGTSFGGANAGRAYLFVLDKESLTSIWHKGLYWNAKPAMDDLYLYCTDYQKIYVYEKLTGSEVWRADIFGKPVKNPVVENDYVYFVTGAMHREDGYLYCMNKSDGQIVFQDTIPYMQSRGQYGGSVAGVDIWNDYIFVPADNRYIYCFDKVTGQVVWKFLADSPMETSPRVKDGILYTGSLNRTCYAIDANTGQLKWSYQSNGSIRKIPPQFYNNYVLFVDDALLILNIDTGKLEKKLSTANGLYAYASALWDTDGKIYVTGWEDDTQKFILAAYQFK